MTNSMNSGTKSNGVIMLSPPRSFSSVVCGILGRHPQLYGVPELNLFVADTIEGWYITHVQHRNRPQSTHGLLRVLAQLHEERQTEQSIDNAWEWLAQRRDWTTKQMWDYLSELVYPRILIDKSPVTSQRLGYMDKALEILPGGYFIHLTRHPIPATKSIQVFRDRVQQQGASRGQEKTEEHSSLEVWHHSHETIMNFTSQLPEGQSLRIQGEKLLEELDKYLIQLAEWLGIRADEEALEAMKHPEYSPYACIGPLNARYGNDLKFLMSPELRAAKFNLPAIDTHPYYLEAREEVKPRVLGLAHQMGYR